MSMLTSANLAWTITGEVQSVLDHIDSEETNRLIAEIRSARKVFIFAVGRVFLVLQCLGKRLGHLGIDCQVVGSTTEKPITPQDLLLIASGSGESKLPAEIARIAKAKGARLGIITSARASTIKALSDFAVHLPCPTKNDPAAGVRSIQTMSTLFDQALHVYGDIVAMMIQQAEGLRDEELWESHANLE
jgi:6-phospho-3-hexuloisomerase